MECFLKQRQIVCDAGGGTVGATRCAFDWNSTDLEKRSRQNNNRGSAVTRNDILTFAEFNKHLRGGVAGLQMLHDSGTVVGDEYLSRG